MLRRTNTLAALLAFTTLCVSSVGHAASGCIKDRYGNVLCGPAGSHCLQDRLGEVKCSPPDGGILLDRYKTPVCGPGRCVVDRHGDVVCSSVAKGAAALNINGDPVCTEGCVAASAGACVTPAR
jgi:hypothetical protein